MHSVQLAYVRRNNKTKAIYSELIKPKIIEYDILGCRRNNFLQNHLLDKVYVKLFSYL